jgi:hypothetical protein
MKAGTHLVIGPVLTKERGYAFDSWSPEAGFSHGYVYRRIEDAHYARNFEIKSHNNRNVGQLVACSTLDEFARTTIAFQG